MTWGHSTWHGLYSCQILGALQDDSCPKLDTSYFTKTNSDSHSKDRLHMGDCVYVKLCQRLKTVCQRWAWS